MKTYLLGTVKPCPDILESLHGRIKLEGVIGLSERESEEKISGYVYMGEVCSRLDIPFIPVENYALKSETDREMLSRLDMDLLLVMGWQRLIPGWLIDQATFGAIGVHGSHAGITKGRGRSPQNWALILGKDRFDISIFSITEGIDSGKVIDSRSFALTPHDDIRSSYCKTAWLTAEMVEHAIKSGAIEKRDFVHQEEEEARYLPQRQPEDGEIDWRRSSVELYNFIRGQTRPYPGAFAKIRDTSVRLWRAIPINYGPESQETEPGTITRTFSNGDLLVKSGDGYLLVEDYTVDPPERTGTLKRGVKLESADFREQIRRIVERHEKKYPKLKVSEDITCLI